MDRLQHLHKLLSEQPQDPFLNHALALEEIKMGRDQEARCLFERLLELNPDYIGSYYHLGKLLERQGEEPKAVDIYERGMEVAKKLGDQHALSELRSAYDNLI
ncbi:MAG: tetratricopeptide repeat protein [Bacteroidetes bacterium]|nr:tetratricopeptide repeat protein [Bacteroidota bacterium]